MNANTLLFLIVCLAAFSYFFARHRAFATQRRSKDSGSDGTVTERRHSLPAHYGYLLALWCALPALAVLLGWKLLEPSVIDGMLTSHVPESVQASGDTAVGLYTNEVYNLVNTNSLENTTDENKLAVGNRIVSLRNASKLVLTVLVIAVIASSLLLGLRTIRSETRARVIVEKFIKGFLIICASIAIFTTVGIVLSVLFESIRFFQQVGFFEFIASTKWSPQTAIRADQVGSSGSFGAVPLFTGTLLISAIALIVAVPLGLMSAIYLAEYASPRVRSTVKPLLEILAGIPTVVYGFFAALTVAPAIRGFGESIGLSVSSESALAAGTVMGIMIIPFVSSLSDDVITAVPQSMRDASFGLGATQSETIRKVVVPAALPGIVGSVLLAASRAIGETMIVVMAAGLAAKLTANPLEAVTTVTVQIVTLLTGDQEFDSAKTLAAFALGLMLFVTTLFLNIIALYTVRRYREQYE